LGRIAGRKGGGRIQRSGEEPIVEGTVEGDIVEQDIVETKILWY
jgi:hypothetical protein